MSALDANRHAKLLIQFNSGVEGLRSVVRHFSYNLGETLAPVAYDAKHLGR